MRQRIILTLLLIFVPTLGWSAQTLASAEAAIDAQIDAAQATIVANINTCLASAEGCYT